MIYQYLCKSCDNIFDVERKIAEYKKEEPCPKCGNFGKRDYSDSKIHHIYKGTGFYCTDYKDKK